MGFSRIDLNLDIGEFVAITGESGSGKSTLLNVISGLDTYEEGEMLVCGEDTTAYDTEDYERYRKTYIGNIFQDFNLINSYTVYQNIELVMLLSGKKASECRAEILDLIAKVGLSEYEKTKVSKLSGGQKQRVAIARALAKDAPIIVADEPTGNLDSVSAAGVMETLSKVSKDKLVLIVTHNYEQAEPYVTRKLTMHDGRIIEDKSFDRQGVEAAYDSEGEAAEKAAPAGASEVASSDDASRESTPGNLGLGSDDMDFGMGKMRKRSELRLGVRNTFNIFAKFMLLFVVYFFVATAVLSQYASSVNSLHEGSLLGYNQYFSGATPNRIVIKKTDETALTEADIKKVEETPNIDYVLPNDTTLDSAVYVNLGEMFSPCSLYPVSLVNESDLTCGSLPKNEYEVVIEANKSSDAYYYLSENPDAYIGKKLNIEDPYAFENYKFDKEIKICGIIIDDEEPTGQYMNYGYGKMYTGEIISKEIMTSMMASMSKVEFDMEGAIFKTYDYGTCVFKSKNVPKGKAYILEDLAFNYKDGKAVGKDIKVEAKTRFFESKETFEVDKVLTKKNFKSLLDLRDFETYYNCIFLNDEDYNKLFDRGYFQVSAFMKLETASAETVEVLKAEGFNPLPLKDTLTDITGGFDRVLQLFAYARLMLEFIILFFIAYGVIKLIMRSRNSYYSTLRILGATKRNTDNILQIELIIMMILAYAVDLCLVAAVKLGWITNNTLVKTLHFLKPTDYVLLGIVLLVMSMLLANRYSKKIFTKSAMKSFRGEV